NQSPALELSAAAHQVTVDAAGGGTAVVPPDRVTLADGTVQFLYLIGSTSDNSVGWLTQTVQGLTSAPAGVPTGTDGLARPARFPIAVFMVLLALAVMTAPALRSRRRGHVAERATRDRKSTRLNSSHVAISYAVFCLKKKKRLCCAARRLRSRGQSRAAMRPLDR